MKFSDFYVWAMDAKRTMGVYFAAYVFVYLFLGLFCGVAALPNLVALEMLLCAMAVGFAQAALVPQEKVTPARCALWTGGSALLTTACALILGWFRGFPAWCAATFCIFLALGYAAMWLGLLLKARRETEALNRGLKNYTKGSAV